MSTGGFVRLGDLVWGLVEEGGAVREQQSVADDGSMAETWRSKDGETRFIRMRTATGETAGIVMMPSGRSAKAA